MEKDTTTNGVKYYRNGLAIGGGSGNLFWKGNQVAVKSDIPAVNNGTLTIKYGSNTKTFTANQSTAVTADLTSYIDAQIEAAIGTALSTAV